MNKSHGTLLFVDIQAKPPALVPPHLEACLAWRPLQQAHHCLCVFECLCPSRPEERRSQHRRDHGNSSAHDADLAEQKAKFMAKAQTTWCRKTSRCDACHQIGHQKMACLNKAKQAESRQEALADFHKRRKDNNIHFRPRKNGKSKQKAPFGH